MNDPVPAPGIDSTLEQPPASYAGRTRNTQLEFEAILANATLGIAFTRERNIDLGPALSGEGLAQLVAETLAVSPDTAAEVRKARGD